MTACYDRFRYGLMILSTVLLCTLPFKAPEMIPTPVQITTPIQITAIDLSNQTDIANLAHLRYFSFSQPYTRISGLNCDNDGEMEMHLNFTSHYDIDLHFVSERTCQTNYLWRIHEDPDWSFHKVNQGQMILTGQKSYPACYLIANSETSYWLKKNTIQLELEAICKSLDNTSMVIAKLPMTTFTL
jgi:hypothetical protein